MQIGISLSLGANLRSGGASFNPASLFASGEEGAWYEPGYGSFQDTNATTEAGEGDPVGFQLDRSQGAGYSGGVFTGLGSELVANGSFDTNTDGLVTVTAGVSAAWESGAARVSFTGSFGSVRFNDNTAFIPAGQLSVVEFDLVENSVSSSRVSLRALGAGASGSLDIYPSTPTGRKRFIAATTTAAAVLDLKEQSVTDGDTILIDNVSVRELPGNHATQSTATSRPTLQQTAGGLWYLQPDGADDEMVLPAGVMDHEAFGFALSFETGANNQRVIDNRGAGASGRGWHVKARNDIGGEAFFVEGDSGGTVEFNDDWADGVRSFSATYSVSNLKLRVDGVEKTAAIDSRPLGSIVRGSTGLLFGNLNGSTQMFDGKFFGAIIIDRVLTDNELAAAEAYMAQRAGVTL